LMHDITSSQCKQSRRDATEEDWRFGRTISASVFGLSEAF